MKRKSVRLAVQVRRPDRADASDRRQTTHVDEAHRDHEIEWSRGNALLRSSAKDIQHLAKNDLVVLQTVLQHGSDYGTWVTPKRWNPTDHSHARMNIDLRKRVAQFVYKSAPDHAYRLSANLCTNGTNTSSLLDLVLDKAVLTLTRYLLILRMGPSAFGRKGASGSLDPSNVRMLGYDSLPRMLGLAISKWATAITPDTLTGYQSGQIELPSYLTLLNLEDFEGISHSVRIIIRNELRRMLFLTERGFWSEAPSTGKTTGTTRVSGPNPLRAEEPKRSPHLPLPDDYVSEMGKRSLWLIHNLAPNLLKVIPSIRQIWDQTDNRGLSRFQVQHFRKKAVQQYLATFTWYDSHGKAFDEPPFTLRFSKKGRQQNTSENIESNQLAKALTSDSTSESTQPQTVPLTWPPTGFGQVMALINHVQLAHLFVVALSTGARRSETLDLSRSCIHYGVDGTPLAKGLTFKLVKKNAGEDRDWALPNLAVEALEQQVRLLNEVESLGPQKPANNIADAEDVEYQNRHLWAQLSGAPKSNPKTQLLGLNHALVKYAQAIGLSTSPGNQRLRHHRFRKTIARLAALAMTQAPKVMMDVFGHKSIEQTLYYILTDKDLGAEIEQVSRELTVMRAKEVIEKIIAAEDAPATETPLAGYGGPAALMVQRSINVQKERLHATGADWGAHSATELADILTLHGKSWSLVRRGVICTKYPGTEAGPCNKSRGKPEPSHCQSHCAYRLEEAFLRDDVDNSIRDAVVAYNKAKEAGDELLEALWAGQVRANIGRFEDLRHKWENDASVQLMLHNAKRIDDGD